MGNIESVLPVLEVSPQHESDADSSYEDTDYSEEEEQTSNVKVDNKWKNTEIKNLGIQLSFKNRDDALAVNNCQIRKWPMDERNKQIDTILSGKDEFIASDIFEIQDTKLTLKEDVTVTVILARGITKRHKVKVKLLFNGKWHKEDATFKGGKAVFRTNQVESFVIVGELVTKKVKVPPGGTKIKVDESSKMEVEIPAGAVENDQDMTFQIIPPDASAMQKYLRGKKPMCKTIMGLTECLYGDSPVALTFKKPVVVKLPFEDRTQKDDSTLVLFRMCGNEIKMMERKTDFGLSADGVCNLQVSSFSGYFAGFVRNDYLDDVKTIESETRLLFGKNYIATILIFREREKMQTGFPKLWVEIVDKIDVARTIQKRTEQNNLIELPNSQSPDIKVYDGFRLRIDIMGGLKGLQQIPKSHYLITYLDVSDDNHKVFTVEKKVDSDTTIGLINFYSDKGSKDCVHSVQVDTVVGFSKVYRTDGTGAKGTKKGTDDDVDIGNDTTSERPNSASSIGSTATVKSQGSVSEALNEGSLFNIAGMINGADDDVRLSIELDMSYEYDVIRQSSQSKRASVFKLLKEWTKKQKSPEKAVDVFAKALKAVKLRKVADVFLSAAKKGKAV